ncbi:Hypothetical protein A7982_00064 [Minicystis rosea]|nr:Hypothetical protein A7982_00064 [Minicystis rosea]
MNATLLLSRIDAAAQQLVHTEQALAAVIREHAGVPRANKTITTRLIENALDRVKVSREQLHELLLLAAPVEGSC